MQNFIALGKKIYNMENPREVHRMIVFVLRSCLHAGWMNKLQRFFDESELRRQLVDAYPFFMEQPTRAFFYNKSTFAERVNLLIDHIKFVENCMKREVILDIYAKRKQYEVWSMLLDEKNMRLVIMNEDGQRKEGLTCLRLLLDNSLLYQINFWISRNKQGEWAMWIGALQGPNFDNAKDVIKYVTKKCHAYRTKNLMLYMAQAVARTIGLKHIYAVTNYGYYANNHIRADRKLKTSFSNFWHEAGGKSTDDKRFDELPLMEARKTMEEVPTRKRAVYRRRFALLDEIDTTLAASVKGLLK